VTAKVSAIVTAYRRIDQTLATIAHILNCDPAPAELIVHVDGGEVACANAIEQAFPGVRLLRSDQNLGPGGARHILVAASTREIVASFDDDAFPIDADYFARAVAIFERYPGASVVAPKLFTRGEDPVPPDDSARWVADYVGAACLFRRADFLDAGGYVPIPIAYGMEEADLALRLFARGRRVLESAQLRARHDTLLEHHVNDAVTAATIANLALLAYLRYPVWLWGLGAAQCARRVAWLIRHDRWSGIAKGLAAIPATARRYRAYRDRLTAAQILGYLRLRRHPEAAT
jgi:glycosyltransferase involved in cell wall biosynthesis